MTDSQYQQASDGSEANSAEAEGVREALKIDGTDRRWRALLELDARLHKQKGVRLLTPEARVLLYLQVAGPVSVTAAMQMAGTSYRGFYAVLDRLKQAGLVATAKDDQDQRVRRLTLAPSANITPADR